jgi:dihydroorotate dehydrogenase
MYSLLRPLLFCLSPEQAHTYTLAALHYLPEACFKKPKPKPVKALGLEFAHPLGLAAGLDKNGNHLDALAKLGFAFIELGTVTPKAQPGNPKPRLFRLPKEQAIINRMGFNNLGVDVLVANVQKAHYKGPLGINIGKNKDTPLSKAVDDYLFCLNKVYEHASYITINISSPNTPDLRQLQQADYLTDLLTQLRAQQMRLEQKHKRHIPLVVKVSPDESDETLKNMADLILSLGIEGIIATNTTASRAMLPETQLSKEQGGLSGRPLAALSTRCLNVLKSCVGDAVCLIGVGGIDSSQSAQDKWDAGANLLQVYSGLVYQGPNLVNHVVDGLCI